MFWKIVATVALVVMLTPGKALAVQYPPTTGTSTTAKGTSTTAKGTSTTAKGTSTTAKGTSTTAKGTSTTAKATSTTRVVQTVPPKVNVVVKKKAGGKLARTGADNVVTVARIGVVLLVLGFLLYLSGRYRRAARAKVQLG